MICSTTALVAFQLITASSFTLELPLLSRREAITGSIASICGIVATAPCVASAVADQQDPSSATLLSLIPPMPFGAPATNATLPMQLVQDIEKEVASLESSDKMRNLATSNIVSGSWRLLYSDGTEITALAKGLPLGFSLGPTYQPLDTSTGRFENRGSLTNKYNLAKLQTNVVGDIRVANKGTLNAIGVRNDNNNRVDVNFQVISFQLDEIFGKTLNPPIRKTLIPKVDAKAAQPANDITYLDTSTRVVRGGDGALFIFRREDSGIPMLSREERAILARRDKSSGDAVVGIGVDRFKDAAPELKFLLKDK